MVISSIMQIYMPMMLGLPLWDLKPQSESLGVKSNHEKLSHSSNIKHPHKAMVLGGANGIQSALGRKEEAFALYHQRHQVELVMRRVGSLDYQPQNGWFDKVGKTMS
jgi:hypothetical protein